MKLLRQPVLHWVIALALGGTFLYASIDKIANPGDFARIVYHYQIIGPSQTLGPLWPNLLAVTLPWIEVVIGLSLVTSLWRREAAFTSAVLLAVFVAAVSSALLRGINLENCGCFSVTGEGRAAGIKLILGDLAMLAGALLIAFVEPHRNERPSETAEAA